RSRSRPVLWLSPPRHSPFSVRAQKRCCVSSPRQPLVTVLCLIRSLPLGCCYPAVLPASSHGIQKERRVFNEELRVLVVRAVIGVGVDDQLRIRHVLLHDEREHRGYVHVVTAVHDECWLLDRLQILVGPLLLDAPIAD